MRTAVTNALRPLSRTGTMMSLIFLTLLVIFASTGLLNAQTGLYTVNGGSESQSGQTYSATLTDQSSVYVLNSGQLVLTNCIIEKTGNSSNIDTSSQYGLNAGILAKSGGAVTIEGGSLTTNASGANGLFATGSGSIITMSNSTINATGTGAHGVDVTYTGTIILNNVNVTSNGDNSSTVATDFGGGTVTVNGGILLSAAENAGSHSAAIYSTGVITINNATATSLADCGGVIDGANSIILNNTNLTGALHGIKIWKTAPASGSATVTISGGSLTSLNGDAFYVTGETGNAASAVLTLSDSATVSVTNGYLLNVTDGSSASLTISNSMIDGILYAESNSTMNVTLTENANLAGQIYNGSFTADSGSQWTLTDNSNVTVFSDAAAISGNNVTNIIGNGHSIHYNQSLAGNSYLNGQIYNLVNGGYLTPNEVFSDDNSTALKPMMSILEQNYPNPFNPTTTIRFTLNKGCDTNLTIFNAKGQKIKTLCSDRLEKGVYSYNWNGQDDYRNQVSSGIYYYKLTTDNQSKIRKMLLIK